MGRDKLALTVGDETLLARTARVLFDVADEVIIAGLGGGHPVPDGSRVVPDEVENAGPLAGIAAGLSAMRGERAIVVACDLPHLDAPILHYLLDAIDDFDAAVPFIGDHPQPTCAAYSRGALHSARQRLGAGRHALRGWIERLRVRWVDEDELRRVGLDPTSLTNVNAPEDWAAVQNELQHPAPW